MQTPISYTKLSETLSICELPSGFWLYDKTRGINLAMRAKTRDGAFTEALTYYQKRLAEVERDHSKLKRQVGTFINQFIDKNEDEE